MRMILLGAVSVAAVVTVSAVILPPLERPIPGRGSPMQG
jgi:hypothetical protein